VVKSSKVTRGLGLARAVEEGAEKVKAKCADLIKENKEAVGLGGVRGRFTICRKTLFKNRGG